jgi:hypothetical protein
MKSEHITTQINTINPDLVRLTGFKENSAPFALASRKTSYNQAEESFLIVFKLFDIVINAFGGNSNSSNIISQRIGVMVLEKQYFGVTKKLWGTVVDGELRQDQNYKIQLSMSRIYNEYKTDLEVKNNNFAEKTMTVKFTDDNYISLLQNNFVNMDGYSDSVEVMNIEWFDRQYKAKITILLPDTSAFNTTTTTLT